MSLSLSFQTPSQSFLQEVIKKAKTEQNQAQSAAKKAAAKAAKDEQAAKLSRALVAIDDDEQGEHGQGGQLLPAASSRARAKVVKCPRCGKTSEDSLSHQLDQFSMLYSNSSFDAIL